MRWALVGAAVLLVGCNSEASDLEKQYEIVAKGRDNQAICDAARKVADAYLRAGNEAKYGSAKLRADVNCSTASFEPYNTQGIDVSSDDMTAAPDNMDALPDNTGL